MLGSPDLTSWNNSEVKIALNNAIDRTLRGHLPSQVCEILIPHISIGKRIRSLFLWYILQGVKTTDFMQVAVAIELFHQVSLIYDDIIDDSNTRDGGKVAFHRQFGTGLRGVGIAQHIAEMMSIISDKLLFDVGGVSLSNTFSSMKTKMLEAQLKDVRYLGKTTNTNWVKFLINECYDKTSLFFAFPFQVGNILLGKDPHSVVISKKIGTLYQIGDDIDDINKGTKSGTLSLTYPFAYLLDNISTLDPSEKEFLLQIETQVSITSVEANKLTGIFRKYQTQIESSILPLVQEVERMIESIEDTNLQNISFQILRRIFKAPYWNYKT